MVQYGYMKNTHNTVNSASKDILAKCMATEDINVEHRADVPTAYFDTKNRTLCLPVWKDMDNSVYDMLVGHEVSHALHTPATGWQDFIGEGKGSQIRHMFVNVVEDARIERLIKDKFPGLRRDFAHAYKRLHDQDMFELKNRTIGLDLPLIDRLNLEFKLGLFGLEQIPFADAEQQYVTRMAESKSFEQVVALAKDLYEKHIDELEDEEEESGQESGSGQGEQQQGEQQQSSQGDSEDEQQDGSQSGTGNEDTDSVNRGGDDSSQSQDGDTDDTDTDTDDGENAEGNNEDGQGESDDASSSDESDKPSSLEYEDYKNNSHAAGGTQKAMESNINEFRDSNAKETHYRTLPNMKIDDIVVDFKVVESIFTKHALGTELSNSQTEQKTEQMEKLKSFLNGSKGVVGHMVQQFQMKQAADADKRTHIAKTGVLDTVNMINYRWSEDVFRKNEVVADGKNHGMIMYLDWSGSMNSILQDTICQLVILTEFCNKVGIPFEVYAFSSNLYYPTLEGLDRWSDEYNDAKEKIESSNQYTKLNDETDITPHHLQLYNFLSSRMNGKQYKMALKNLWMLAYAEQSYSYPHPQCLGTGCTPLNEAIMCALDMVPAFQHANQLQIVNTVFLTDGEGHGCGIIDRWNGNHIAILRDHKTRRTYKQPMNTNRNGLETHMLLELLRERTGTNLVGIRLQTSAHIKGYRWQFNFTDDESFYKACEDYKKNNFCLVPSAYDLYFLVKGHMTVQTDALENLNENASIAKIKNAFIKGSNNKKSTRVIAGKMVEVFAK